MKVKEVIPVNNQVLIEELTPNESLGTAIYVGEKTTNVYHQAIILALGPLVNKDCGFKVGDRVVFHGSYLEVPNYNGNGRNKGVCLPDTIKAVISVED